ncbi:MAG: redox-sensing transcriptional repressor Rex [Bacteroidales bacterium]|nr:redox-sensing transcriptional repressor Rex [Bacteroidales bacterium]
MHSKFEILRLLSYRMCLNRLKNIGFEYVFSYYLGEEVDVSPEQIRRDLASFGIRGKKKSGYHIEQLILDIEKILGNEGRQFVIIVGMGNIGNALIDNDDFKRNNIDIIAGFDIDPVKLKRKYQIPVFPNNKLEEFIHSNNIKTAVLAVPALSAQEVCNNLVSYGIRGILNFAPVNLKVEDNIVLNNVNLCSELTSVIYLANHS